MPFVFVFDNISVELEDSLNEKSNSWPNFIIFSIWFEIFIFILINEETVKSETGSKLRLLQQVDFELRVSNCRSGCKNGCTQRWERRDEIVIFMFSARAGNISLALIHFPPYLSALIPIDLPDRSERSDHRLSRSAPCPSPPSAPSLLIPIVVYTHHQGKGLSAPLRRGQSRSGRDTLTGGGRPRAICVNIPTYFELWSLAEKQRRLKEI